MKFNNKNYIIEVSIDDSSIDEPFGNKFNKVYFEESEYIFPTKIGIKIFQNNKMINSAIIGSVGGGTGIHKNSLIIEDNRLIICCSNYVFCMTIPNLELEWKTKADFATCFAIFKLDSDYIVHGELEISKLNSKGEIIWKQSGADIFTTEKGDDCFEITKSYIQAKDWSNNIYKFSFDGEIIK